MKPLEEPERDLGSDRRECSRAAVENWNFRTCSAFSLTGDEGEYCPTKAETEPRPQRCQNFQQRHRLTTTPGAFSEQLVPLS